MLCLNAGACCTDTHITATRCMQLRRQPPPHNPLHTSVSHTHIQEAPQCTLCMCLTNCTTRSPGAAQTALAAGALITKQLPNNKFCSAHSPAQHPQARAVDRRADDVDSQSCCRLSLRAACRASCPLRCCSDQATLLLGCFEELAYPLEGVVATVRLRHKPVWVGRNNQTADRVGDRVSTKVVSLSCCCCCQMTDCSSDQVGAGSCNLPGWRLQLRSARLARVW